ncbi:TIGR04219 family outer membrane beta-barrel protein [Aliikangiella marina]|uniref:TIGR04219 family outer membrane beta-barrel protein n=1 Tax=Aliikangiella marina TaxID=1712262 RepID=A0A545TE70_9GAMM|nr:TIGR04219 family outer membrane beta-barrel protein [Aliikangiella marina]TQV75522.1 TIGR04219 family outer membrane beta-barrel protein [Aliikangiella marina]
MKKLLGAVTIASLSVSSVVQADVAGFEVGGYQWTPDYSGTILSSTSTVAGSTIDLQNDLGFTDESHNVIYFSLEHPIPVLPNLKITSSDFENSSSGVITRDLVFGGETFSVSENVTTVMDTSNMEYTLYYEILDNWINWDIGATIRQYDGEVGLSTPANGSNLNESELLDFTIPLFYTKARFDLPFTGFFIDGQINIISYDDDSVSDTMIALGYESEIGFGASLGYRSFDLEAQEDDLDVDLKFDGTYFNLFFHF